MEHVKTAGMGAAGAAGVYLILRAFDVQYKPVLIASSLFAGIVTAGWYHNRPAEKPSAKREPLKWTDLTLEVKKVAKITGDPVAAKGFTFYYKGCPGLRELTSEQLALKSAGTSKLNAAMPRYNIRQHLTETGLPVIIKIGGAYQLIVGMSENQTWLADPSVIDPKDALVVKPTGEVNYSAVYLPWGSPVNTGDRIEQIKKKYPTGGMEFAEAFDLYYVGCDGVKDPLYHLAKSVREPLDPHAPLGDQGLEEEWVSHDLSESEDKENFYDDVLIHLRERGRAVHVQKGDLHLLVIGAGIREDAYIYFVADPNVTESTQAVYALSSDGTRGPKEIATPIPVDFLSGGKVSLAGTVHEDEVD